MQGQGIEKLKKPYNHITCINVLKPIVKKNGKTSQTMQSQIHCTGNFNEYLCTAQ